MEIGWIIQGITLNHGLGGQKKIKGKDLVLCTKSKV